MHAPTIFVNLREIVAREAVGGMRRASVPGFRPGSKISTFVTVRCTPFVPSDGTVRQFGWLIYQFLVRSKAKSGARYI